MRKCSRRRRVGAADMENFMQVLNPLGGSSPFTDAHAGPTGNAKIILGACCLSPCSGILPALHGSFYYQIPMHFFASPSLPSSRRTRCVCCLQAGECKYKASSKNALQAASSWLSTLSGTLEKLLGSYFVLLHAIEP